MLGMLKHSKHPPSIRKIVITAESNALRTIVRRKIMFRTLFTAICSGQTLDFQGKLLFLVEFFTISLDREASSSWCFYGCQVGHANRWASKFSQRFF